MSLVSLSGRHQRELGVIAAALAQEDPLLARQLSQHRFLDDPAPRRVTLLVMVLGWALVGFGPLYLGVAWANPWIGVLGCVSVLTTPVLGPWLSLHAHRRWRRRRRARPARPAGPGE